MAYSRDEPVAGRMHPAFLVLVGLASALSGLTATSVCGQPLGRIEVQVVDDASGTLTPVRAHLREKGGAVAPLPAEAVAVMYGLWDHADGYGYQPDSSFYVPGNFSVDLPPGVYELTLTKGNEYLGQQHTLTVEAGNALRQSFRMQRWIDMPARGWYSGDDHIHIRRSPREDPLLMDWIQAEDVHVGVLLRMGDFWEIYYPQYAWGKKGVYQEGDYLLTPGQEDPRTPELGHALGMGMEDRVRYRDEYYYYDKVFDRLHELGGVTGYAHQGESFHGYRGLMLDGLRGKVDMLEILQFCVSEDPLIVDHYYHLLDLGYEITAVAGSDFPWCGNDHDHGPPERNAQIGNVRFYTYTDGPLTYESWKAGLNAGRTFVTTGPIVELTVNGRLPGDKVDVAQGDTVRIRATAYGHPEQAPVEALEIVGHGEVLGRVSVAEAGQTSGHLALDVDVPMEQGMWIAARVLGGPGHAAHTTPVYVTVNGGGFHNPKTAPRYLDLSEQYLQELEHELEHVRTEPEYQAWRYREGLEARIAETRRVIEALREKLR